MRQAGYQLQNLDCIVFAERPKLGAYKQPSASGWPRSWESTPEQVGLQAKTGEGVGPIGREEAISAQCVVLLSRATRRTDGSVPSHAIPAGATGSAAGEFVSELALIN